MQQPPPPLHTLWTPEILRWRLGKAASETSCTSQSDVASADALLPSGAPVPNRYVPAGPILALPQRPAPAPDSPEAGGHSPTCIVPGILLPDAALTGKQAHHEAALAPRNRVSGTQRESSPRQDSGPPPSAVSGVSRDMERVARLAVHGGRSHVLLLGTPSRHEIQTLLDSLPEHVRLVACSMSPELTRTRLGGYGAYHGGCSPASTGSAGARNVSPDSPAEVFSDAHPAITAASTCDGAPIPLARQDTKPPFLLLCDTSPWALLLLLHDAGVVPETTLTTFCASQGADERPLLRQLRKLFLMATRLSPPSPPAPVATAPVPSALASPALVPSDRTAPPAGVPPLHACAILHPHEPGLDAFFAQLPDWLSGMTVIWDGDSVPVTPDCAVPVRHVCRPLDADFAAQRNAMLDAAPHEWVVYLDADETLSPGTWSCIRTWAHHAADNRIGGIALPRHTFLPDGHNIRAGFGLWPDIQLRLFRNVPGVRFEGRIHERVTGLSGGFILLPGHPILHHSLTGKDRQAIEARLRTFDLAAGRSLHRLSHEYPGLPRQAFEAAAHHWGDAALYFRDA